jgi:hypothetical protein
MSITINGVDYENHEIQIIGNQTCLVVPLGEALAGPVLPTHEDDDRLLAEVISLADQRRVR